MNSRTCPLPDSSAEPFYLRMDWNDLGAREPVRRDTLYFQALHPNGFSVNLRHKIEANWAWTHWALRVPAEEDLDLEASRTPAHPCSLFPCLNPHDGWYGEYVNGWYQDSFIDFPTDQVEEQLASTFKLDVLEATVWRSEFETLFAQAVQYGDFYLKAAQRHCVTPTLSLRTRKQFKRLCKQPLLLHRA